MVKAEAAELRRWIATWNQQNPDMAPSQADVRACTPDLPWECCRVSSASRPRWELRSRKATALPHTALRGVLCS